jgi:hypothetical protein
VPRSAQDETASTSRAPAGRGVVGAVRDLRVLADIGSPGAALPPQTFTLWLAAMLLLALALARKPGDGPERVRGRRRA